MIRLAAIDLDGTLLHDDMTVSEYTKEVIKRLQEKGVRIVIATGRMFESARDKTALLNLGDVPLICYTGAWTMMSESGRVIHQEGIAPDVAEAILQEARRNGWNIHSFLDDHIYMPGPHPSEAKYQKYRVRPPFYIGEEFYHPQKMVTRMVLAESSEEKRNFIRQYLETHFGDVVDIVFPGDDFIDVSKKGVTKAWALERLCDEWQIEAADVIAFGNTENDAPMLRWAGLSYAVSNGEAPALAAAQYVCESNNEDGVAKVLSAFLS